MADSALEIARAHLFAAAREWVRRDGAVMRAERVTQEQEHKLEQAEAALRKAVERLNAAERDRPS